MKILILLINSLNPYSPQERTVDNEIFVNVFEMFSKLTYQCPKNQEYFMKKNCYKLIEPIFKLNPVDMLIMRPLVFTLANCCDQNDYQLYFWSDDFTKRIGDRIFQALLAAINLIDKNQEEKLIKLKELELYLIFMSKAVRGCGRLPTHPRGSCFRSIGRQEALLQLRCHRAVLDQL